MPGLVCTVSCPMKPEVTNVSQLQGMETFQFSITIHSFVLLFLFEKSFLVKPLNEVDSIQNTGSNKSETARSDIKCDIKRTFPWDSLLNNPSPYRSRCCFMCGKPHADLHRVVSGGRIGDLNSFIDPSLGNEFDSLKNTATLMTLPDFHNNPVR